MAATTEQRQDPARIGILLATAIHAEPDGVFKPGARRACVAGFARCAHADVEHFFGRRHFGAVHADKRGGNILGRPLGQESCSECLVLVIGLDGLKQIDQQPFAVIRADLVSRRHADPVGRDAGIAQHRFDTATARMRHNKDRGALFARASGAARPVLEGIGIAGELDMDDERERRQINATRGNISRDADSRAFVAEGLQRGIAFVLAMLARQRDGVKPALDQAGVEVANIVARGAEQHCGLSFVKAQQIDDRIFDVRRRDGDGLIGDVAMPAIRADGRDAQGILLIALGQRNDGLGHGRREHERAAFGRTGVEDILEVFAETHVEHFVGFIEDGDTQGAQIERATIEVIAQAARRADDDMRALRQRFAFLRSVHAADAGRDARTGLPIKPDQLAADLQREFAGRGNDERLRLADEADLAIVAKQLPGHCESERNGLARSGLRRDDQVAVMRFGFEDSGLNRRRGFIATGGQSFGKKRRERFKWGHRGRIADV